VGDLIDVSFHNHLPESTTIHWHGLAVPNGQDGVGGITQDPVPSGSSARYAFVATTDGTYWYHSHQNSLAQLDRGLYGVIIIAPRTQPVLRRVQTPRSSSTSGPWGSSARPLLPQATSR